MGIISSDSRKTVTSAFVSGIADSMLPRGKTTVHDYSLIMSQAATVDALSLLTRADERGRSGQ